jgi:hypothetical protein
VCFVQLTSHRRDKRVVGVFVRFRAASPACMCDGIASTDVYVLKKDSYGYL